MIVATAEAHNVVAIDCSVYGFLFAIHDCGNDLSFKQCHKKTFQHRPLRLLSPSLLEHGAGKQKPLYGTNAWVHK